MALHDWNEFEDSQILQISHPFLQESDIIALHESITSVQICPNRIVNVFESVWSHPSLVFETIFLVLCPDF